MINLSIINHSICVTTVSTESLRSLLNQGDTLGIQTLGRDTVSHHCRTSIVYQKLWAPMVVGNCSLVLVVVDLMCCTAAPYLNHNGGPVGILCWFQNELILDRWICWNEDRNSCLWNDQHILHQCLGNLIKRHCWPHHHQVVSTADAAFPTAKQLP